MIIEVRLMRHQGRRLPWKEIDHGRVFRGNLQTVCVHGSDRPIEPKPEKNKAAQELGRHGGLKGGAARAKKTYR